MTNTIVDWFRARGILPESQYSITTTCPACHRNKVTVYRLKHVAERMSMRVGEFFKYSYHLDTQNKMQCPNSGKHPAW